jgi:hypothetical protein
MALPRRIPKKPKRASRWRSIAHCNFVRSHACSACGDTAGIQVAHVRIGSGTGLGQKPDDWLTVSLCGDCHRAQHSEGEKTFWRSHGKDPRAIADEFAARSPKAAEIRAVRREREAA